VFCLLTWSLLGEGAEAARSAEGLGFIRVQAEALEARFGATARHAYLLAGVAVLLSTELGVLDATARVSADVLKSSLLLERDDWSLSRVYFSMLWLLVGFGILVLASGLAAPLELLVLSASLNAVVMFLYSGLLLALNLRAFRTPLRPGPVRIAALCAAFLFFGYFSLLTIVSEGRRLLGG
jgi:hypothetical protein